MDKARRMVARHGVDKHPVDHLLDTLQLTAQLVEVYGQMVADLDWAAEVDLEGRPGSLRGEVWWESEEVGEYKDGTPKYRMVPHADRLIVFNRDGLAKMHPFVGEYHEALDRKARLSKMALDANVDERRVAMAESQGRVLAEQATAWLDDPEWALTGDQKRAGRKAIARSLRLLQGGKTETEGAA